MLHIINKSPSETRSFYESLGFIAAGDAVILIEDAVFAANDGHEANEILSKMMNNAEVFALEPDLKARGILKPLKGLKKTDYDGFVKLVENHDKSISWL